MRKGISLRIIDIIGLALNDCLHTDGVHAYDYYKYDDYTFASMHVGYA